jgi:N-acetylneuraminic acid mutarotase
MGTARLEHTATLLADGRVLVAGGQGESTTDNPTGLASAELYDPASGTFSPTGPMAGKRVLHTATLLADGRVLVTGGAQTLLVGAGFPLASGEIYDPKSGTFSPTGSMATARVGDTATLLADGRVFVAGGEDVPNAEVVSAKMLASAELYDPKTGMFSPTASMSVGRAGQTATPLADGRVLLAGGVEAVTATGPGPFLASAELFDPKTGTLSATGP